MGNSTQLYSTINGPFSIAFWMFASQYLEPGPWWFPPNVWFPPGSRHRHRHLAKPGHLTSRLFQAPRLPRFEEEICRPLPGSFLDALQRSPTRNPGKHRSFLQTYLVDALEHVYFSIYWEKSSQLTNIFFQRGRYTTNQILWMVAKSEAPVDRW